MAAGCPVGYKGVNVIGLKRRGFSSEAITAIRRTYRLIYRSKINRTQALDRIRSEVEMLPEVKAVLDFVEKSERGLIG
jgi:UDP-N-acetylglucosamine acyltransferase